MSVLDLDAIDERWNAATENVGSLAAQYDSAQDIPALLAEVGRLAQRIGDVERERDEARDLVDHWCLLAVERGQELDVAAADLVRLRQELDEARAEIARLQEHEQTRAQVIADHQGRLIAARDVAAERDRMRPVVEAAEAYVEVWGGLGRFDARTALIAAIDAYRTATPDAEPTPGVRVDTEEQP